jgi:hypothetical protein
VKKLLLLVIALFVALVTLLAFNTDNNQQIRIDQATTPEQLATALLYGGKSQVTFDHGVLLINRTVEEIATASMAVSGFNFIIALVPAVFAKFPQVQSIVFHESGPFRDITGNDSTDEMLRIAFTREESDLIHWG